MDVEQPQHLNWNAEALWQRLLPLLPDLSVEVLARVDSTNTRLLDRARAYSGDRDRPATRPADLLAPGEQPPAQHGRRVADVSPCLLVAEHQTRGRGRQGRSWIASPGASLTFSLSLPLAPADWSGLSLAVGLALAEAFDPLPQGGAQPPRIGLKWPNDLWLLDAPAAPGRGRKLGGVLIETVAVGDRRMCVVGIGLNVAPQPVSGLTHGYACLQEIDPAITAPLALARLAEPLVRALLRFQQEGFAPLTAAYARRDLLRGLEVTTSLPGLPQGVAEGVDGDGALLLRHGALHRLVSGEVAISLPAGAA